MNRTSQADISTRHFPDVSDSSFQIPSFRDTTSGLLRETQLGGMELDCGIDYPFDDELGSGRDIDPFTTPLPRSQKYSPLRLSEITPRHEREFAAMAERRENGTGSSKEKGGAAEGNIEGKNSSVRHTLPKKGSIDDMFERRKRDNYQQMGIDLSSKSTARLRNEKNEIEEPDNAHTSPTPSSSKPTVASNVGLKQQLKTSGNHISGARKINTAGVRPKRHVIVKNAGIAKHKYRASTSTTQPKSILKPSKPPTSPLPHSTFTRTLTAASHSPEAEPPKWGDVVEQVQQTSQRRESSGSGIAAIGGGLIDVLVMYGEKLKGSFGFPSASKTSTPQANGVSASLHSELSPSIARGHDHTSHMTEAGPSSRPLRLSDLSPAKSDRSRVDAPILSCLSSPKHNASVNKENEVDGEQLSNISPMHPSKKRSLTEGSSQGGKKGKFTPEAPTVQNMSSQPVSKREKITGIGLVAKKISKPRPLGASRTMNTITTQSRSKSQPISAKEISRRLGTASSARELKNKFQGKSTVATDSRKEQDPPGSLSSGPSFASNVYRQRALEKTQREREEKDARAKEKRNFKAGFMPHFSKPAPPARPAIRPTIPAAFNFHSDARAAQRHAEFEEKRKTWESHATHQALPMPDFAAIHAAQAESLRGRKVVPVLPTDAPTLTTMVRAKEREKFEAERRERERVIEEQLEMRERERAEEEEREYREARKRTVPKAHEVPEWYKDLRREKSRP